MMNQDESKDYGPLLMGLIDGELSTEEALEVNEALRRSATLREEYERLLSDAGKLKSLSQLEASDLIARRLWKSPYHRLMRNGSVWMILGGYGILILYAIYQSFVEEGLNVPGVALAAMVLGAVTLLASFIRERVETYKTDPYKEIER
ncbi:MAG: hypothetical protein VXZ15_16345 [Planctomycetota bacterium]|nr:hypothetical protein [Planctomycetota bacterium]MEC7718694.1 hypothetical protein [Planctomycetota bacterium]MEC8593133.1 hypothetical protein [Planctomycetota bacterium]